MKRNGKKIWQKENQAEDMVEEEGVILVMVLKHLPAFLTITSKQRKDHAEDMGGAEGVAEEKVSHLVIV